MSATSTSPSATSMQVILCYLTTAGGIPINGSN